jgi:hypothetical protein
MKKLIQISIVAGLLGLSASTVHACSCADPSQRAKFRKADVVFLGEIVERPVLKEGLKDHPLVQAVTFSVKRQWKGPQQKQMRVLIDFDTPGMCGDLPLVVGSEYLMYAYREREGLISAIDCGPNMLARDATADMKNLNSFWFRLSARLWPFN